MRPSESAAVSAARTEQFTLFGAGDRKPSLTDIGVRLRERYRDVPCDEIPERFARLLERLDTPI